MKLQSRAGEPKRVNDFRNHLNATLDDSSQVEMCIQLELLVP
jgi:hypothetical protein